MLGERLFGLCEGSACGSGKTQCAVCATGQKKFKKM